MPDMPTEPHDISLMVQPRPAMRPLAVADRLGAVFGAKSAAWIGAVALAAVILGAHWLGTTYLDPAMGPVVTLLVLLALANLPSLSRPALAGTACGLGGGLALLLTHSPNLAGLGWAAVDGAGLALASLRPLRAWRVPAAPRPYSATARADDAPAAVALADIDPLTFAVSQTVFDSELEMAWDGDPTSRIAALLIDLDGFAAFNDRFGTLTGDTCLASIAATLQQQLRADIDLLARYDGEEFAVMLPGSDQADAAMVAERIRAAVQALAIPHPDNDPDRVVTVSIGCASAQRGDSTPDALMDAADRALFSAKQAGRNRIAPPLVVSAARSPVLAGTVRRGRDASA